MMVFALCLLKAYKIPATAITDKTPMMAMTLNISKSVLPAWHRRGERAREGAPPLCDLTIENEKWYLHRRNINWFNCPNRPGRFPRAPAPAGECIRWNNRSKFPRVALRAAGSRGDPFLGKFTDKPLSVRLSSRRC